MARLDLDELLKVAPESKSSALISAVDPDDEYNAPTSSDGESASDNEAHETESRRHYVDVGPSEMRRRARLTESDKLEHPKYKGTRVSRHDMFGDGSQSDEDSMADDTEDGEAYQDAQEEDGEDDTEGETEAGADEHRREAAVPLRAAVSCCSWKHVTAHRVRARELPCN